MKVKLAVYSLVAVLSPLGYVGFGIIYFLRKKQGLNALQLTCFTICIFSLGNVFLWQMAQYFPIIILNGMLSMWTLWVLSSSWPQIRFEDLSLAKILVILVLGWVVGYYSYPLFQGIMLSYLGLF